MLGIKFNTDRCTHPTACLCVLLSALLGGGLFVVTTHYAARAASRQLLRNFRAASPFEAHITYAMNYAAKSSEYNDVVFIGDSSCRCDILPSLIEERTGWHAYNLGSMGTIGLDGMYVTMETYLRHHPAPRAIVLCFCPINKRYEPVPEYQSNRQRFLSEYGQGKYEVDIPTLTEWNFRKDAVIGAGHLYGLCTGGSQAVARLPIETKSGMSLISLEKAVKERHGWFPDIKKGLGDRTQPRRQPCPWVIDISKDPIAKMAKLAESYGSVFIVRLAPAPTEMNERITPEQVAAWEKDMKSVQDAHVIVSAPAFMELEHPYFIDEYHLGREGATILTAFLIEELQTILSNTSIADRS